MCAQFAAQGTNGHPQFAADHHRRDTPMGITDKVKNAAEDAAGKTKEQVGKLTGDKDTEGEGKKDQTKSSFKKAGENVKDAFK
jgi:uncharacterized protein YjbJ (UPF0337 family)